MSFSDDLEAALASMPTGVIKPSPLLEEVFEILPDDTMRVVGLREVASGRRTHMVIDGETVPMYCDWCAQNMYPDGDVWVTCPNDRTLCIDCCECCG